MAGHWLPPPFLFNFGFVPAGRYATCSAVQTLSLLHFFAHLLAHCFPLYSCSPSKGVDLECVSNTPSKGVDLECVSNTPCVLFLEAFPKINMHSDLKLNEFTEWLDPSQITTPAKPHNYGLSTGNHGHHSQLSAPKLYLTHTNSDFRGNICRWYLV